MNFKICKILCKNYNQEVQPQEIAWYKSNFVDLDDIEIGSCKTFCEICKKVDKYMFLFCQYFKGFGKPLLICPVCENYNGGECEIIYLIVEEKAQELAKRDRRHLWEAGGSEN